MRISGRISMNPSWRKPVGMFLILGIIAVWAVIIASMAHQIARLPGAVQMVIYAVAGIVWILPLKPLLAWMEPGKWQIGRASGRVRVCMYLLMSEGAGC